jgi:cob(I)alamin adenosyltransferase
MGLSNKKNRGLIIVYTGDGKGKTTASLGLALRTIGWGGKVLIIQFAKAWKTGEHIAIEKYLPDIKIVPMGLGFVGILGDKRKKSEHSASAKKALGFAKKEIMSKKWSTVILDEINGAIVGGLVTMRDVLDLIVSKPEEINLVLTGREARPEIIAKADLVTEMKKVKHPFDTGVLAKKGIDF